ncbi:MAG: hypothetical protein ABSE41_14600 [Bacteroidota bacterium]|jgi:transcriptional regulator with XRE-family HTH domain
MDEISAKKFIEIWDEIAKNEKLTDTGLCSKLGIHPGTVARWRAGRSQTVRLRLLRLIQEKLGYRLDLKNDGSIALELPEKGWQPKSERQAGRPHDTGTGLRKETLSFPLAASVHAAGGSIILKKSGSLIPFSEFELRDCFCLQVDDSSTEPLFFKGDTLLVSRRAGRFSEGLAVIVSEESTKIRRVVTDNSQVKLLMPSSLKQAEPFVASEEIICPILCTFYSRSENPHKQSEL